MCQHTEISTQLGYKNNKFQALLMVYIKIESYFIFYKQ